jgi:hypothetical protein
MDYYFIISEKYDTCEYQNIILCLIKMIHHGFSWEWWQPNFESSDTSINSSFQKKNNNRNSTHRKRSIHKLHPLKFSRIFDFIVDFHILFGYISILFDFSNHNKSINPNPTHRQCSHRFISFGYSLELPRSQMMMKHFLDYGP